MDSDQVYPRAYGGNEGGLVMLRLLEGLSPRIRGKLGAGAGAGFFDGSIPAHTGETSAASFGKNALAVYPRAYGGNRRRGAVREPARGLSPRIRGKRSDQKKETDMKRSIPAHTGETHGR